MPRRKFTEADYCPEERWQHRKKAAGLCQTCGKGPLKTKSRCAECDRKQRDTHKARRDELRAQGLCVDCGRPAVVNKATGKPFARCWWCRVEIMERNARRREAAAHRRDAMERVNAQRRAA